MSPDVDRATQMAASLRRAAARLGLGEGEADWLKEVFRVAMARRLMALDDDHHPACLHPGRSALVLVHDVGRVGADVLATAMLLESRDLQWRASDAEVRHVAPELPERLAAVPHPGDEDLVERLVLLDPGTLLAALAERLDHLRHEHLREPLTPWPELHAEVGAVWLPMAERAHPQLARRYRHWHRTFARRL